jgi:tRNA(adenine34) deaminase
LRQHPQALRQTPKPPMVPASAATSVAQAMEYFAPFAKP